MTRALNMDLVYCYFDAANIHRWNDHLRPIDLTEIDKQAHKAVFAWIIGKYEELENSIKLDWKKIIEGILFSFLKRTVLTDLKPQLLHRMEDEKFDEVNNFVISEIKRNILGINSEFMQRFEEYIRRKDKCIEDTIVDAAHYLATNWEFDLIYEMNKHSFKIEQTKKDTKATLNDFNNIAGVKKALENESKEFMNLIGQLRFQQRWTHIERVPKTSVLGHSLMVAIMAYLNDLDTGADDRTSYNDFYTGLFHDIPEVLTKDVISPVKTNVEGLVDILDGYEHELVESMMIPLLPEAIRDEFRFLLFDPFSAKEDSRFGKVSGPPLKMCDLMSAYIEANASRRYGITNAKLKKGEEFLRKRLKKEGSSIGASELITRLNAMQI